MEGIIDILVVGPDGMPVTGGLMITLERITSGRLGPELKWDSPKKLPFGSYRLVVRGSPAYPVERIVRIRERRQVVIVGLFVAPIGHAWPDNIVRGKLPETSIKGDAIGFV